MDAFRGAAILLVILQHSTGIPRTRGVSLKIGIIESLTGVLAPYRMPLLLLLSGLLLGPSLNKPLGTYFSGKDVSCYGHTCCGESSRQWRAPRCRRSSPWNSGEAAPTIFGS